MRDDDFAGLASGQHTTLLVDDFHHHVFGGDVHAALRALVGDEACVARTVAIGHGAAEHAFDGLALFVVQAFAGAEGHADAQVVHHHAALFGVLGHLAQRRRIAEQHARAALAYALQKTVEPGVGHLEGGQ